MQFFGQEGIKEKAMEIRTGIQRKPRRFQVLPGSREAVVNTDSAPRVKTDIVCLYGVAVQRTAIDRRELVEFEFLPDAA